MKQVLSKTADPVKYILVALLHRRSNTHKNTELYMFVTRDHHRKEKPFSKTTNCCETSKSASWLIDVKKLLWTYDLQDIETLLGRYGKDSYSLE